MASPYDEYLNFANLLADESEKIIFNYFRKKIDIENKPENKIVKIDFLFLSKFIH